MASAAIRIETGSRKGECIPLNPETTLRIGRNIDNDVVIRDKGISRFHCSFSRSSANELEIDDAGSKNGVYVNGDRVESTCPLHYGDQVLLGHNVRLVMVDNSTVGTGHFATSDATHTLADEPPRPIDSSITALEAVRPPPGNEQQGAITPAQALEGGRPRTPRPPYSLKSRLKISPDDAADILTPLSHDPIVEPNTRATVNDIPSSFGTATTSEPRTHRPARSHTLLPAILVTATAITAIATQVVWNRTYGAQTATTNASDATIVGDVDHKSLCTITVPPGWETLSPDSDATVLQSPDRNAQVIIHSVIAEANRYRALATDRDAVANHVAPALRAAGIEPDGIEPDGIEINTVDKTQFRGNIPSVTALFSRASTKGFAQFFFSRDASVTILGLYNDESARASCQKLIGHMTWHNDYETPFFDRPYLSGTAIPDIAAQTAAANDQRAAGDRYYDNRHRDNRYVAGAIAAYRSALRTIAESRHVPDWTGGVAEKLEDCLQQRRQQFRIYRSKYQQYIRVRDYGRAVAVLRNILAVAVLDWENSEREWAMLRMRELREQMQQKTKRKGSMVL